jgi:hypothetical protein
MSDKIYINTIQARGVTLESSNVKKLMAAREIADWLQTKNIPAVKTRLDELLLIQAQRAEENAWLNLESTLDQSIGMNEKSIYEQRLPTLLNEEAARVNDIERRHRETHMEIAKEAALRLELEKQAIAQAEYCGCAGKCECVDAACTSTQCRVRDARCAQSKYKTLFGIPNPLAGAWRPCAVEPDYQMTGPSAGGSRSYFIPRRIGGGRMGGSPPLHPPLSRPLNQARLHPRMPLSSPAFHHINATWRPHMVQYRPYRFPPTGRVFMR